ncbi:hypothetical protein J5277_28800 [Rhizobium sp. 16-449-1b]|uniref:hypothetical protein n=1 Tax=Rhizobium sp. 16-449-1b TaxID=2819989 RepID=UPI001ADD5137|nr:hypothetical protein [Rhizobium sp. 16-449-1b]MBO9198132.1 hypothetical protein [Rhizobium sp. 16-449-1b]
MSLQPNNCSPRRAEVQLSETDHVLLEDKVYVPYRQKLGYLLVRSDKPECQRFVSHAGLLLMLETAAARIQYRAIAC